MRKNTSNVSFLDQDRKSTIYEVVFAAFRAGLVEVLAELYDGINREDLGSPELYAACSVGAEAIVDAAQSEGEGESLMWWAGLAIRTAGLIRGGKIVKAFDASDFGKKWKSTVYEATKVRVAYD